MESPDHPQPGQRETFYLLCLVNIFEIRKLGFNPEGNHQNQPAVLTEIFDHTLKEEHVNCYHQEAMPKSNIVVSARPGGTGWNQRESAGLCGWGHECPKALSASRSRSSSKGRWEYLLYRPRQSPAFHKNFLLYYSGSHSAPVPSSLPSSPAG